MEDLYNYLSTFLFCNPSCFIITNMELKHVYVLLCFLNLFCFVLLFFFFTQTISILKADVAIRKHHQQLNEILYFFLPTLHPGISQVVYKKALSCNTLAKLDEILCTQHEFVLNVSVLQSIRLKAYAWQSCAGKRKKKKKTLFGRWWCFLKATSLLLFSVKYGQSPVGISKFHYIFDMAVHSRHKLSI